MIKNEQKANLESGWNDAKGYLEVIREDLIAFSRQCEMGNFDLAYGRIVSLADTIFPYSNTTIINDKKAHLRRTKIDPDKIYPDEAGDVFFSEIIDYYLEEARKEIFRKIYNLKDDDDRTEKATHDNNGFEHMRKVKKMLLMVLHMKHALLPLHVKSDWLEESTKYM